MERYDEVVQVTGRCAYDKVHLVFRRETRQFLAMKKVALARGRDYHREAQNEVTDLVRLRHDNIVRYIDAVEERCSLYIFMAFYPGDDLLERIGTRQESGTSFTEDEIFNILRQLCQALEYIHEENILHRDIKPRNIFFADEGTVKLGGFGFTNTRNWSLESANFHNIGTFLYAAPEMFSCPPKCTSKCDMWSLGCVLYELVTLKTPYQFEGDFLTMLTRIASANYDPLPADVDPDLRNLIADLIQEEESDRLTATEVLDRPFGKSDLRTIISSISNNRPTATEVLDRPIKVTEPDRLDFLLIGKTGSGKSATGNSILRRNIFESAACITSVTTKIDFDFSEFNGRVIKVVDCPGIRDTSLDNKLAVKQVINEVGYAIAANPPGYHAFLFVLRYDERFTAEDKVIIDILKLVFGEGYVKNYCILVLTCGDLFEQDIEETGQSFHDWCAKQGGIFKDLLNECDNRAILFNNRTTNNTKRCAQLAKLLQIVDNLHFQGHRYTDENFARAKDARERAIVEAKIPIIQEETVQETSLILQKLQEQQYQQDLNAKVELLEELKIRAENLCKTICSEGKGTGALCEIFEIVKSIQCSVEAEINFCAKVKQEREENKKQLEEIQIILQELMERQKKMYDALLENYQNMKKANNTKLVDNVGIVTWPIRKFIW